MTRGSSDLKNVETEVIKSRNVSKRNSICSLSSGPDQLTFHFNQSMYHCLWTLNSVAQSKYNSSQTASRLYCDRPAVWDGHYLINCWTVAVFLRLTMVSRKILLTSRWGYILQIDEQQNISGARTRDDYCGKMREKSLQFIIYITASWCSSLGQPQVIWKSLT